tara:strand:+ start:3949 stop:4908 length:960 start_codon:yes stop_codon:yes gene_type:complete
LSYSKQLNSIKKNIKKQTNALLDLQKSVDQSVVRAVNLLFKSKGKIIITGIGKSGYIGLKLSATLSSTGSPSTYINSSEASHGDLGLIQKNDILIALSKSGETKEMMPIINFVIKNKIKLIAITSNPNSFLAKSATISCLIPKINEACPLNLAPTTSTTMMLVLGDSIAIELMNKRKFNEAHFKKYHPGGMLGHSLLQVKDLMHTKSKIPLINQKKTMREALLKMTSYGFGCVGITNEKNILIGIITDGDLRRNISKNFIDMPISKVMTKKPLSIEPSENIKNAIKMMNDNKITALFVSNKKSKIPQGIIHIHDCIKNQ